MASSVIQPIAVKLAAEVAAITVASVAVKSYVWAPGAGTGMDAVPCGVVEMPDFRRRDLDEAESELGQNDWTLTYPVVLYVDLSEAAASQAQLVELVEAFVARVNANPSLTNTVYDAVVVDGEPFLDLTVEARPLAAYRTSVQVWKLTTL